MRFEHERQPDQFTILANAYLLGLLVFAIFAWPIDIALSPTAITRYQVASIAQQWFVAVPVLCVGTLILVYSLGSGQMGQRGRNNFGALALTAFGVLYLLSKVFLEESVGIRQVATTLLLPLSVYFAFTTGAVRAVTLRRAFFVQIAVTASLAYHFVATDSITYVRSHVFAGLEVPQIRATLFQSTEMSNIIATTIIVGLYAFTHERMRLARSLMMASLMALSVLLFAMGSLGSLIVLASVLALLVAPDLATRRASAPWNRTGALVVVIALCALIYYLTSGDFPEAIGAKLATDRRNVDFANQLEMARTLTWFGNGNLYVFDRLHVYPHNNVLGILIEHGLIACGGYLVILGAGATFVVKSLFGRHIVRREEVLVMKAMACCAVFIMMKGFVHDTWQDPSFLLWSAGLFAWLARHPGLRPMVPADKPRLGSSQPFENTRQPPSLA